jgi:hypothetical protein
MFAAQLVIEVVGLLPKGGEFLFEPLIAFRCSGPSQLCLLFAALGGIQLLLPLRLQALPLQALFLKVLLDASQFGRGLARPPLRRLGPPDGLSHGAVFAGQSAPEFIPLLPEVGCLLFKCLSSFRCLGQGRLELLPTHIRRAELLLPLRFEILPLHILFAGFRPALLQLDRRLSQTRAQVLDPTLRLGGCKLLGRQFSR